MLLPSQVYAVQQSEHINTDARLVQHDELRRLVGSGRLATLPHGYSRRPCHSPAAVRHSRLQRLARALYAAVQKASGIKSAHASSSNIDSIGKSGIWQVKVRSEARNVGLRAVRKAAAERAREALLAAERHVVQAALSGTQPKLEAGIACIAMETAMTTAPSAIRATAHESNIDVLEGISMTPLHR